MSSVDGNESSANNAPQEIINQFWENLITKKPAKVTKIFPPSLYANLLPPKNKRATTTGKNAAESYEAAASECRARVKRIVQECHRINEKFTDPEFDIEDLDDKNCLQGLKYWYKDEDKKAAPSSISPGGLGFALPTRVQNSVPRQNGAAVDSMAASRLRIGVGANSGSLPTSVHRVDWIFEDPQFEIDGFHSSDVVQGSNGDCWFIAALATICSNPDLIKKVCIARDEECGVYGFVFYRDGEWTWTVVDDNLYLRWPDFDSGGDKYDPTGVREDKYKKSYQTGSEALFFGSCAHPNETWLPLLEKAYAKVHGDYQAISGGWSGEAVEDLTGGVTTKILTGRILSKDRFWKELLQVNKEFLFSASSPGSYGDDSDARRGLALNHAYSVLRATEEEGEDGKKHRLVLIRNPWGRRANPSMGEWTGPWSDGSREWTPYWLKKLDHTFGDDGIFWMSYEDLLQRFDIIDRTRLFGADWTVVQTWTSVSVAWVTGYLNTKFSVEVKKAGPTVFVLCQLDDRYFLGLEGKYEFDLHFVLQEKGAASGEHIVRARGPWFGNRSISAEIDLEVGTYEVLPKIEATRDAEAPDVHEVVTKLAEKNPQKLRQIGLNYDIANAKGARELTEEERKKRDQKKKEAAEQKKKKEEEEAKEKEAFEAWKKEEKAEYEAWKREKKAREEKEASQEKPTESKTTETKDSNTPDTKTDDPSPDIKNESTQTDTTPPEAPTPPSTDSTDSSTNPSNTLPTPEDSQPSPPSSPQAPTHEPSPSTDDPSPSTEKTEKSTEKPAEDSTPKPWNAVCVLGLRVYARDAEVSIKLLKPKDAEEGAILDVDGTAAGATM